MQLNFSTDLAIKALTYMALAKEDVLTLQELAKIFDQKDTAFKRPFRKLTERGIVGSVKGRSGGYLLKEDPANIYLGELIALLENTMQVIPLMKPDEQGLMVSPDSVYRFTAVHATRAFLTKFDSITIGDLASDPNTLSAFGIRHRNGRPL